jgi:hypothetical protein
LRLPFDPKIFAFAQTSVARYRVRKKPIVLRRRHGNSACGLDALFEDVSFLYTCRPWKQQSSYLLWETSASQFGLEPSCFYAGEQWKQALRHAFLERLGPASSTAVFPTVRRERGKTFRGAKWSLYFL